MDPQRVIQAIRTKTSDLSRLDDDELFPSAEVVDAAVDFISGLWPMLDAPGPPVQVGTFYGEVNLTWRWDDRMVRLAFFPDRPTQLVFGGLSEPTGSYRSEANPSHSEVAARLGALAPALV